MFSIGFNIAIALILQIVSGIILSWSYSNSINEAFYATYTGPSQTEVPIVKSVHIVVTSFIFILMYVHIYKVLYTLIIANSSIIVWVLGYCLLLSIIIIAFLGYVLPATQMSYWGLTVFSNIISTFPIIGNKLVHWIWTAEFINKKTLQKIHSLHIVLPLLTIQLILMHILYLHHFLSSDTIERFVFHIERDWVFRDTLVILYTSSVLTLFIFINWHSALHEESWEILQTTKTPEKVLPEWLRGF